MKYNKLSRRMFLQGSGGALLAIPFLESLLPSTAWGQTSAPPKRFIGLMDRQDYGHNSNWLPNASGSNAFNIPQPNRILTSTSGDRDIRWQPLREFAPTNSSFLAPIYGSTLSPYLESINLLRSLDFADRRAHDSSKLLGGLGTGGEGQYGSLQKLPTIDQIINNKIGDGRPLIFGGDTGVDFYSLAPDAVNKSVRATSLGVYLNDIYNSIFRSGTFPETAGGTPVSTRRDILNRVLGDYSRVIGSRNISSLDKVVLTNAMDKISDVQRSLSAGTTAQCSYKSMTFGDQGTWSMSSVPATGKALADLISVALMCDAARVFTIGMTIFEDLYQGEVYDHQTTSHTPFAPVASAGGKPEWQIMGERHAYIYRNFIGPLMQNLSGAIDTNGKSILYNSLIYNGPECGQVHGWGSQPVLLAGNAGGALSSGNYIDYADRSKGAFDGVDTNNATDNTRLFNSTPGNAYFSNNWYGVPYNRVLVTCLQAMGLQPSDYENDSINKQLFNRTDMGALNNGLTSIGGYGHPLAVDLSLPGATSNLAALAKYDLKKYRYKLPMP